MCVLHTYPCQKNRTVPISQDGGKTFPRTGAPGRILPQDSNRFLWGSVAYLLQPSNSGFWVRYPFPNGCQWVADCHTACPHGQACPGSYRLTRMHSMALNGAKKNRAVFVDF